MIKVLKSGTRRSFRNEFIFFPQEIFLRFCFRFLMFRWMISKFPPQVRLTSVAISYNIAVSIVGGFSPALATLLVDRFDNSAPGYIVTCLAVLAWFGLWLGRGGSSGGSSSSSSSSDGQVELVNNNLSSLV